MAEAYLGEIRIFAGNFPPRDWALCDGQLLPLAQNTALFSLLGTTYGGDGRTTFALPDLRGAAPMHFGHGPGLTPRELGERGGTQSVALTLDQLPSHSHVPNCTTDSGNNNPEGAIWGSTRGLPGPRIYADMPNVQMNPLALNPTGGSGPHNNMQPYLAMTFIICMSGIFPPRG